MSDLMLTAVLSMPYDMAMGDDLSRRQFWDRAQQALAEIESLTAERDELRRQLAEAEQDAERYRWLRGREDGRYMTVYAFRTDVDEVCLGEELDATIDAAMGGGNE